MWADSQADLGTGRDLYLMQTALDNSKEATVLEAEKLPNGAGGEGTFIRYTIPALELRLMLEGARRLNETFTLEYTQVQSSPPGIPL